MPQPFPNVGYIGLGIMGGAMADNLLKAGIPLTVWNRTPGKAAPLTARGAQLAQSPAAVARQVDILFLNVSDTPDVEQILFGPDGVVHGARPGTIIVDNSTISPTATVQFGEKLAARGLTFLDAPVSGGDIGAKNATLTIMVGGDPVAFERCLPLFRAMGKTVTHLGPVGSGQACKACNQVCVALTLLGVCEALALADRLGLDPQKMVNVIRAGAAQSWQLEQLGPKIASGDMAPGFMVDLMLKDLRNTAAAAAARQLTLPGAQLVTELFAQVSAAGAGRAGTQALSRAVGQLQASGTDVATPKEDVRDGRGYREGPMV